MKRYWKLILLVTVIILTFSSFYIHSSLAISKLPKFTLKHLSGDQEEVKPLIINGAYEDDKREAYLHINYEGSNYEGNLSYIDMLKDDHLSPQVKKLQKKYRSFMRDKQEHMDVFLDHDDILIYANVDMDFKYNGGNVSNSFTFEIETLDKQTKKTEKFTTEVPKQHNYDYVFVQDVQQTKDGQLKVITRNATFPGQADEMSYYYTFEEMHVYTFDLQKQRLKNDEVIKVTDDEDWTDDLIVDVFILSSDNDIKPKKYIVFDHAVKKAKMQEDGFMEEELLTNDLIVYEIETDGQRKLDLPDEIDKNFVPILYTEPTIIFEKYESNQYEVIKYNIINEEIELKQTIDLKTEKNEAYPLFQISDDKIYIVSSEEKDSYVQIVDMYTGEFIYEGKIEIEENGHEDNYKLELYNIDITK